MKKRNLLKGVRKEKLGETWSDTENMHQLRMKVIGGNEDDQIRATKKRPIYNEE